MKKKEASSQKEEKNIGSHSKPYQWLLLPAIFVALYLFQTFQSPMHQASYSDFLKWVNEGTVEDVEIGREEIRGILSSDGKKQNFSVSTVNHPELVEMLRKRGVAFRGVLPSKWVPLLASWILPLLFFFFLWRFIFSRGATGGMLGGYFHPWKNPKQRSLLKRGSRSDFMMSPV